jgi:hypothetical protein
MCVWVVVLCLSAVAFAQQPAPPEAPAAAPKGPKASVLLLPTMSVQNRTTAIVPDRINEMTRKRMQEEGRVVLLPTYLEQRRQQNQRRPASAVIIEAEQLYTSGIGLVNAGENQRAVEVLQKSVDLLKKHTADLENFNVLSDALANLALAYWRSGFDLDGRKYIKEYAYLQPAGKLNAEKYPAELLAILDEEQKKIAKGGPGKVVVTANVDGAKVFIDGVAKGVTPVMVEDVGFGVHYLVVRTDDGKVWAEEIKIKGRGQQQAFSASLEAQTQRVAPKEDVLPVYYTDVIEAVRSGKLERERLTPYLGELAREVGTGYVGWVMVYKEQASYVAAPFVWRAADGRLVRVKPTKFNAELSNLTFGVNELSANLAVAIEQMPEADAVDTVEVGPKALDPVVIGPKDPVEDPNKDANKDPSGGDQIVVKKDDGIVPPPEVTPAEEDGFGVWTYVGVGAAVVVVGGIIVGGVMLLGGDDAPVGPSGFDAEVSW